MHVRPQWEDSTGRTGPSRPARGARGAVVELARARVREGYYDSAPSVARLAERLCDAGDALGLRDPTA